MPTYTLQYCGLARAWICCAICFCSQLNKMCEQCCCQLREDVWSGWSVRVRYLADKLPGPASHLRGARFSDRARQPTWPCSVRLTPLHLHRVMTTRHRRRLRQPRAPTRMLSPSSLDPGTVKSVAYVFDSPYYLVPLHGWPWNHQSSKNSAVLRGGDGLGFLPDF
jgi:hypothetical protein